MILDKMEEIINMAFAQYSEYQSKAAWLEQLIDASPDPVWRRQLERLNMKILVVNCWIQLLNQQEAYVVTKRLIDGTEWMRVVFEYGQRFGKHSVSERTLQRYLSNAMQRIIAFSNQHIVVIESLFQAE